MSLDVPFEDVLRSEELHFASQDGDFVEVTRLLLASGADVNAHDERIIGDTVLRDVASNCSFDVAKILVDAGADPTIPGWMLLAALDKSEERKKPEGVRVHQLLLQAAR